MADLAKLHRLNAYTVRDCLDPEHLPKYELSGKTHFLILRFYVHSFEMNIGSIQELTDKIAIFYSDDFLITIHKSEIPFLKVLSKKIAGEASSSTASELLTKMVWNALDTFNPPAERLAEQVDFYELQVMLKKSKSDLMEALYYIKRQALLSHKVLILMAEPINHIYIKPGEETYLQDVKDQHLKMQTLYSGIIEEVNNLVNLSLSLASQRANEVMRVLTIFSVFFMPLTFVAGVYGMNFKYMPELDERWAYPATWALMIIITLIIFFWFRKKKWL